MILVLLLCAAVAANGNIVKSDCDPKLCKPLENNLQSTLQPGEKIVIENVNCCPVSTIICDTNKCPPIIEYCEDETPATVTEGKCCSEYSCGFSKVKCVMELNGEHLVKYVGDNWNDTQTCTTYECLKDENGETFIYSQNVTCDEDCPEGFEPNDSHDQCCPLCVKSKCMFKGQFYDEGQIWKNGDDCTFYECVKQKSVMSIISFKKSCPTLGDCPLENIYTENCCIYCNQTKLDNDWVTSDTGKIGIEYFDENAYKTHPCQRKCTEGGKPMECYYTFLVEWYETLSKACYNCPYNSTDCSRPHCITGDGVKRSVLVVNRMMPGPAIEVCENDMIIVDVKNHLLGESTTIHWHGLHQRNTPYMDGVPHISQCPIPPGGLFRYTFKADNPGTHFWHSHTGMQRGDGSFGALIIRKSVDRYDDLYDYDLQEHLIILNDWAHTSGVAMFTAHHHSDGDNKPPNLLVNGKGKYFPRRAKVTTTTTENINRLALDSDELTTSNLLEKDLNSESTDAQPVYETIQHEGSLNSSNVDETITLKRIKRQSRTVNNNALIRTESRFIPLEVFSVKKGNRYRFRLVNAEFLNCPMELSIDGHNLTVISSDGFYIKPIEVKSVVSYAGERFDFILNANQNVDNYWIKIRGLMDCDERFTSAYQVAILRYKGASTVEPENYPDYDFQLEGIQLNALNKGTGEISTVSIAETTSVEQDDYFLLQEETDFKFYVYYDFYAKDNPHFHVPNLYGFSQVENKTKQLFTPQLNHISMKMPSMPLMPAKDQIDESQFCNASSLAAKGIDCRVQFCECSHVLQVPLHSTVEMVLIDEGFTFDANHPFHLHGNAFRVVGMERLSSNISAEEVKRLDEAGQIKRRLRGAPIKDTVTIPDGGYTIIRFIANNPGYWLFHCHIEFHAEIGMALVLKVGDHKQMKPVPSNFPTCYDYKPSFSKGSSTQSRLYFTASSISLTIILLKYLRCDI